MSARRKTQDEDIMGIQGLLKCIPQQNNVHIREYAGKRVAIDGSVWLFQATSAYIGRRPVATVTTTTSGSSGSLGRNHVGHFLKNVRLMLRHDVTPVIVFDGVFPPSRLPSQRSGTAHHVTPPTVTNSGSGPVEPLMPRLIKIVRDVFGEDEDPRVRDVLIITTPYESDPQMAYLARLPETHPDHVHAVITEDSDLLAFGTPRVLFKFDNKTGTGSEARIFDVLSAPQLSVKGGFSIHQWPLERFQAMCVLSGCEYLDSVRGVGLITAHSLMSTWPSWRSAVAALRRDARLGPGVPPDYEVRFQRAMWYFAHAVVYSPSLRACTHLSPLPRDGLVMLKTSSRSRPRKRARLNGLNDDECSSDGDSTDHTDDDDNDDDDDARVDEVGIACLGCVLSPELAQGIAEGRINPVTRMPF